MRGLSQGQARARLERRGTNELTAEKPVPAWRKFLAQFQAVAALRQMSAAHANVIRDGARQSIPATEVVPGDIIVAERRAQIGQSNEELAGAALRTLGVTFRSLPKDAFGGEAVDERIEQDLVFLGLIGMVDPPRQEAKDAVARAKGAGIRPMMITGDHPKTAAVIAAELGIIHMTESKWLYGQEWAPGVYRQAVDER
jgi:Ca2+-transporting ATPase